MTLKYRGGAGTIYRLLQECSDGERETLRARAIGVAKVLIDAGAEVDANCQSYSGGKDDTTLNLLVASGYPAEAGVLPDLVPKPA